MTIHVFSITQEIAMHIHTCQNTVIVKSLFTLKLVSVITTGVGGAVKGKKTILVVADTI